MPSSLLCNPQLAIMQWSDALGGNVFSAEPSSLQAPALRLLRYDDAWRPLAEHVDVLSGNGTAEVRAAWREAYGGQQAAGRPPEAVFPHYWPAAFDQWAYAGDLLPVASMFFAGELTTRPVATPTAEGIVFTLRITDLRDPDLRYPQRIIRLPVGIEMPLAASSRVYGTAEMFSDCRQLDFALADPALPRSWYYLEAELFGGYAPRPGVGETFDPGRPADPVHAGAPFAAVSADGRQWWGVASEADYGAATLWGTDRVRHFTTLFLQPGGTAEWSFVLWRQETSDPQQLLLAATRADGFFNLLNPLGFTPKGTPEGPIIFANVSRLPYQLAQVKQLRPGLVLLNYHYDHISSTANLYGAWRTYEGFAYSETQLKGLIEQLKQLGCRVGYYGTHATQPESHRVMQQDDYLLDAWGRRIHDWEPGNWIADPGHADAAERYARAEAEFAHHYGLDAVFVDRLDFMAVNHNPARAGQGPRLELAPSLRLGLIELNRQRMRWQRKLNPHLFVGLNNTTQWAGIRYSDFCLLEGGEDLHDYSLPWLLQPHGVVNKRHCPVLFGDYSGLDLFQTIGETGGGERFLDMLRGFIRRSLVSGVIAQPYGDEIFVDRESMFFREGLDKAQPDERKAQLLAAIPYYGGAEWRAFWDAIAPALEAARRLTVPVANVWHIPPIGDIAFPHRFLARQGDAGGLYLGLLNESDAEQHVELGVAGHQLSGIIPAQTVRVWWYEPCSAEWQTLAF